MDRINRPKFLEPLEGKAVDVEQPELGADVQTALRASDLNHDGKIAGHYEQSYLFDKLTRLSGQDEPGRTLNMGPADAPTPLGRTVTALAQAARPAAEVPGAATPLDKLLARHPEIKTNQDLLNYFMSDRVSGHEPDTTKKWNRAQKVALSFGVDINVLAKDRDGSAQGVCEVDSDDCLTLEGLVRDNPALRTNQDLINFFLRSARGHDWGRASARAQQYGLDLNALTRDRGKLLVPERPRQRPIPAPTVPVVELPTTPPTPGPIPVPSPPAAPHPGGALGKAYGDNVTDAARWQPTLSRNHTTEMAGATRTFERNRARYERVSAATGIPAELVAAIHYRESSMNFGTYLHQGDPLGRPAVHVPTDIPVFHNWEDAAIHALNQKKSVQRKLGITAESSSLAEIATYAERYNGFGYHNRGLPSPYAWSGTDIYRGGRYVRDHVFDRNSWDRRPGVVVLFEALRGTSFEGPAVANQSAEAAWAQVLAGNDVLRRGESSEAVTYLQSALAGLGYPIKTTGTYDFQTEIIVKVFQTRAELEDDGEVGRHTARAVRDALHAQ